MSTYRVCAVSESGGEAEVVNMEDYRHNWRVVKAKCRNCGAGSDLCPCGCGKLCLYTMREDWDPDRLQCPDCGQYTLVVTHFEVEDGVFEPRPDVLEAQG